MSYIQSILNRRLGVLSSPSSDSLPKPPQETPPQVPPPTTTTPQPTQTPQVPVRNARGAGRKKNTPEEIEARKQKIIDKLSKSNSVQDADTIKEIQESASQAEIKEEIKTSRKKLQLLNSALTLSG